MRKTSFSMIAAVFLLCVSGLQAQTGKNTWLGGLITGGSLAGSSANTLGGLGHFSAGLSGSVSTDPYDNYSLSSGSVSGVLALGILEGSRLGPAVHGILSVDAFLRVGKLTVNGLGSDGAAFWGLGGRVGILRNSILTPAVSVSFAHHETGEIGLGGRIFGAANPVETDLSVNSFRVDVSKNLFVFTPYGGFGANRVSEERGAGSVVATLEKSESVAYGGLEWNILVLRLGLEVMRTAGETIGMANVRVTF